MKPFASILVPLDGSETAARSLGCATWLATRLGARLHVLNAAGEERPPREQLRHLRIAEEHWPIVTLHQALESPEQAVLDAIERVGAQLVVMTARGEAAAGEATDADTVDVPLKLLGHVTRWIVEHSPVPVLVLPPAYQEHLPWTSALVPVSGEVEADAVLTLAVRLANALDLKVKVAHVLGTDDGQSGLSAEIRYADSIHHEVPSRLQQLISRALPQCTPGECACIEDVVLCRGDTGEELLKLIEDQRTGVLVAGWHGRFVEGHAQLIKALLSEVTCPLLLVKAAPSARFSLKVGDAIE